MCDSPITVTSKHPKYVEGVWTTRHPVSCGKCPVCRKNRCNEWVFRLMIEERYCIASHFVTLTYDTWSVPLTKNNMMTLHKGDKCYYRKGPKKGQWNGKYETDLQKYIKAIRKKNNEIADKKGIERPKVVYWATGEYGDKNYRPHYHLIIFNVLDSNIFAECWKKKYIDGKYRQSGIVHIGNCTSDSVAYCLKYLDKENRIPLHSNDKRRKEYNIQSLNIGAAYLTDQMIEYHKRHLNRYYLRVGRFKYKMPRYYADKIFTEEEKRKISYYVGKHYIEQDKKKEEYLKRRKISLDLATYKDLEIYGRWINYKNSLLKNNRYV